MGHLRGECNHPVVVGSGGDGEKAEAAGLQGILYPLQQRYVIIYRRNQHHRCSLEQACPAVFKAGELGASHGMPAHKGKAVFFRNWEAPLAYQLLCAAAVNHQRPF